MIARVLITLAAAGVAAVTLVGAALALARMQAPADPAAEELTVAPLGAWRSDAFGLYRSGSDAPRARWAGLVLGADDSFRQDVAPAAVRDLAIFAGPKSQPAGKDRVHIVALGFDAHGNAVADGTRVQLTTGDGRGALRGALGGIADLLHDPSDRAALYHAGATAGAVQSSRAIYRVVADISSMAPALDDPGRAELESFADLATTPLTDRFGNRAEDGLALPIWLEDATGDAALLTGIAAGGLARARLLTRGVDGPVALHAALGDRTAPEATLDLKAMRAAGPLDAQVLPLPDIDAMQLRVGPFLTDAGHVLNDGALARIETETRNGHSQKREAWIRDGMAELMLPGLSKGLPLSVTVSTALGVQTAHPRLVLAPVQRTRE